MGLIIKVPSQGYYHFPYDITVHLEMHGLYTLVI